MKATKRKKSFMKIFRIVLMLLCSIILVLGGMVSLVLHGYISKLNIVTEGNEAVRETSDQTGNTNGNTAEQKEVSVKPDKLKSETVPSMNEIPEVTAVPTGNDAYEAALAAAAATNSMSEDVESFRTDKLAVPVIAAEKSNEVKQKNTEVKENPEFTAYLKAIEDNYNSAETPVENSNVQNILLISSDSRASGKQGRSDSMILITLNKAKKEITATSILRDIYLKIPGEGLNKIKAAYTLGGAELLMDTLEQNFKIKVNEYMKVDIYTFIDMINAVGGLTLEVSKEEIEVLNDYIRELNLQLSEQEDKDTLTKAGTYQLNGKQVLAFTRNRYEKQSDFDRTDSQKKILQAIYNKIYTLNPIELNNLLNTILPKITTNIREGELLLQLLALPSYSDYKVKQFCIPVKNSFTNQTVKGMDILCIDFKENRKQLYRELYHIK